MAVSKQLLRSYLVYDFKDGLSIVTECVNPVGIMLSVNALPDNTGFRISWWEICLFVINPRSLQSQVLDDEAMKAAIVDNSSQTCGELAETSQTSDETVRLHLHRIGNE